MSTYKLHYFNGRGRAEVSRLIFAAAGQKFEDIRYEREQWQAHKSEMPLGQIPVLEFEGVKLPQSISIARFLAKQFNLAGRDNFEQAKVDAVADTITDLINKYVPVRHEKDETKKAALLKTFVDEELPKHLKGLETLAKLYSNGGPYFVGNHLTWVDLFFYDFGFNVVQLSPSSFDNHSWLKENMAAVEKQPRIAEYLKTRPETSF